MNDYVTIKSRRSGNLIESLLNVVPTLKNGEKVYLVCSDASDRFKKLIVEYYKTSHDIKIKTEKATRKEPQDNRLLKFDTNGEVVGIEILEQKEIFTGWILSLEK